MVDGRLRFAAHDQLSPSQIKSYFSKLTGDRRRQSQLSAKTTPKDATTIQEFEPTQFADDDEDDNAFDSLLLESNHREIRAEIQSILESKDM